MRQYSTGLKRWWCFCASRNMDNTVRDFSRVLLFLSEEFQRGASYGTLNSYRSALAFLLSPAVAVDPDIKRFFKGIQLLRPTMPRYEASWDPQVVLKYLSSLDSNNIPLPILSQKLTTLIALATAQRLQTLSVIDVRNIIELPSGIEIKIPDRLKTSRHSTFQPILFFPHFRDNPQICVLF
ncbi:hypothetical protein PPYR_09690 [Photinus pyralis]|uniref:Core-binding (CB) domain-containing protein n=1 Tax=Photinus pyralis TaxID=7054 RepID=A0A5N4AN00_PHOPY|nr:hypothetical protein PPYR_09690 [Photinus pyralis]